MIMSSQNQTTQSIGENRSPIPMSGEIPANGTKPIDTMSKAVFANSHYTIAPMSNKQGYGVISKSELHYMGKK